MPNYVNQLIDPVRSQQQATNALAGANTARMVEDRNALAAQQQGRLDEQWELQKAMAPTNFLQLKQNHISRYAKNISSLPPNQRVAKYNELVNKIAPSPITEHEELGPLGAMDPGEFLAPEQFAKLNPKQQSEYLKSLAYSADALSKIDLADKKHTQKIAEIEAKYNNDLAKIGIKKAADIEVEKVKTAGDISVEKERTAGDIAKEKEKGRQDRLTKAEQGTEKTQKRLDTYQKEIARLAEVRQRIRKGDKLDAIAKMMAALGDSPVQLTAEDGQEEALKKIDQYEAWLKRRINELSAGDNPLGLTKSNLEALPQRGL
jgi:hypothetical protein